MPKVSPLKLSLRHERWIAWRDLAILVDYREISPRDRERMKAITADAETLLAARKSGNLDQLPEDIKGAEERVGTVGTRLVAGCVTGLRASQLEEDEMGAPRPTGKRRPLALEYYNGDGKIHDGIWKDLDDDQKVHVLRSYPKLLEALTDILIPSESPMLLGK